ncbi:MAG TPA: M14 family metallopeptidase [Mycobacteriales bacterium]|nr:M14 family metallopeptidase [Mycobacteriales bacterium]
MAVERVSRRIPVAEDGLTGRELGFDCHEQRSGRDGPTVVVLGGVHGDEPEGVLAAGRLCAGPLPLPLRRGMLRVVPVCNEEAVAASSRVTPTDGGNLARSFPGDPAGALTDRLAAVLTKQVLADADLLIDLHTAGRRYDMPPLVGSLDDGSSAAKASRAAALAFGLGTVWLHRRYSPGRSLSVLAARGRPAIYAECPGGEAVDPRWVDAYVLGVRRVLAALELADPPAAPPPATPHYVSGGGDLDSDVLRFGAGGLFVATVAAGETVEAAQPLGRVLDVTGRCRQEIRSPAAGRVMFLRRAALVRAGDVAACLAVDVPPPGV